MEVDEDKAAETRTGVRNDSILNELKYFHCTQNYVFDFMHDILEGQAHYDLKLVMAHMTSTKEYDLDVNTLNHRINAFNYGPTEIKDKPSATQSSQSLKNVMAEHKLQERAVQTWCLLRIFPFLVHDKVSRDDPYLQHIINLNKINEIVFAPKLQSSIIPYLHELIRHHFEEFRRLFPTHNPINKLHHLSHYALCIVQSGPLRPLACFKYEANHLMFKKYGTICCNFKNLPKTLINISQLSQCAIWGTKRSTIRKKIQTFTEDSSEEAAADIVEIFKHAKIEVNGPVIEMKRIEVYGLKYEINLFAAIDSGIYSEKNLPIFGQIERIFINKDEVYLYCNEYITEYLYESVNAYHITKGSNYKLVNTQQLSDSKLFSPWKPFSSDLVYICLRHILM